MTEENITVFATSPDVSFLWKDCQHCLIPVNEIFLWPSKHGSFVMGPDLLTVMLLPVSCLMVGPDGRPRGLKQRTIFLVRIWSQVQRFSQDPGGERCSKHELCTVVSLNLLESQFGIHQLLSSQLGCSLSEFVLRFIGCLKSTTCLQLPRNGRTVIDA